MTTQPGSSTDPEEVAMTDGRLSIADAIVARASVPGDLLRHDLGCLWRVEDVHGDILTLVCEKSRWKFGGTRLTATRQYVGDHMLRVRRTRDGGN